MPGCNCSEANHSTHVHPKPTKQMLEMNGNISLTEKAAVKIKEIMKDEGRTDGGLRISIVAGGCSGYMYDMNFGNPEEGDVVIEKNGVKLIFDNNDLELMSGTTIDFVNTLQESGFKIDNPNSTGSCSCGKSVGF